MYVCLFLLSTSETLFNSTHTKGKDAACLHTGAVYLQYHPPPSTTKLNVKADEQTQNSKSSMQTKARHSKRYEQYHSRYHTTKHSAAHIRIHKHTRKEVTNNNNNNDAISHKYTSTHLSAVLGVFFIRSQSLYYYYFLFSMTVVVVVAATVAPVSPSQAQPQASPPPYSPQ